MSDKLTLNNEQAEVKNALTMLRYYSRLCGGKRRRLSQISAEVWAQRDEQLAFWTKRAGELLRGEAIPSQVAVTPSHKRRMSERLADAVVPGRSRWSGADEPPMPEPKPQPTTQTDMQALIARLTVSLATQDETMQALIAGLKGK
jgi:hypothetical protein